MRRGEEGRKGKARREKGRRHREEGEFWVKEASCTPFPPPGDGTQRMVSWIETISQTRRVTGYHSAIAPRPLGLLSGASGRKEGVGARLSVVSLDKKKSKKGAFNFVARIMNIYYGSNEEYETKIYICYTYLKLDYASMTAVESILLRIGMKTSRTLLRNVK